jgi:hypothetical protein
VKSAFTESEPAVAAWPEKKLIAATTPTVTTVAWRTKRRPFEFKTVRFETGAIGRVMPEAGE